MNICCFPFFNEIDIVEVKLATLKPVIDLFVICEIDITFSGKERELLWPKLSKEIPFLSLMRGQIVYLPLEISKLSSRPKFTSAWDVEAYTRNALANGFEARDKDTVVFLTDADEVPDPYWIIKSSRKIREQPSRIERPLMARHCYYVNWRSNDLSRHEQMTCGFSAHNLSGRTMESICRKSDFTHVSLPHGIGWHFGWMGGAEKMKNKLSSFAHTELATKKNLSYKHINNCLSTGKDLFGRDHLDAINIMDWDLPSYLVKNKKKFLHLWSPEARVIEGRYEHSHASF